jgi:redox-sensitive bicupin YhaK (pirin superfamily)
MIEGAFHHRDNLGNDSVIGVGGTQRFTSGRGARHSEMPASDSANRGLQLWVNLPRRLKAMDPSYRGLEGDALPLEEREGVRVRVISGAPSPVDLQTEVDYLDVALAARAGFVREVPAGWNALLYVLDGELTVLGERVQRGEAILPSAGTVSIEALADARLAWLAGRPHGEPIRQRGPFVD